MTPDNELVFGNVRVHLRTFGAMVRDVAVDLPPVQRLRGFRTLAERSPESDDGRRCDALIPRGTRWDAVVE
jgi:hypothetical protein